MQAWFEEHLMQLRRDVAEQRTLHWMLAVAFAMGLAAQVVGYLLRVPATTGLVGLLADLLYTLGWALWTGVVIVVFVQRMPEADQRQIERALEAYEAKPRDRA